MGFFHIPSVRIAGLSACVPRNVLDNKSYQGFYGDEAVKFIESTGIERHRIADDNVCASDLCLLAAEKLIADLNWDKDNIDCLIFVTQFPDYQLPATSLLLQNRLGLKEEIFAFDISLGCSGWIYGLTVIANILSSGQIKKGLLLVGDTPLKGCSIEDKSTYPLFGDAGTATALEFDKSSEGFRVHVGSDGSGYDAIIIKDGAYRNQVSAQSFEMKEIEPGIKRNDLQVVLDGMNVFSFGISKAPESINKLSEYYQLDLNKIDFFLFHQANLFLNEKIRKKIKAPLEKVPYSLKEYGNTSSATIPLTMVSELSEKLKNEKLNLIACGFGVGLSWGSVQFFTENIVCSPIIIL